MSRTGRRSLVLALLVALAAPVLAPTAAQAVVGPRPAPSSAAALQAQAEKQAAQLAAEQGRQNQADQDAATALETHQAAQRAAEQAAAYAQEQRLALQQARIATTAARSRLDRYAGSLYRNGTGTTGVTLLSGLKASSSSPGLFSSLSIAQRVGGNQADAATLLTRAEQAQTDTARRADAAEAARQAAVTRALSAKIAADAAVQAARDRVRAASVALADTQVAAEVARQREELLARAETIARSRSSVPVAAIVGALAPRPGATCQGRSTAGYQNGRIPESALCPLWGTGAQMLRADASAAFDELSHAYAATFGTPVCVSDSYRSYDEQVAVAIAKPTLAATPGSSNHGWGLAVDLCDGIESFGSATHVWMQQHAVEFGFFHPSWAQQGGVKPEAWHWEFAG